MNRHYDGVYRHIALSHRALGDLPAAIGVMTRACMLETPWDAAGRALVRTQKAELVAELVAELESKKENGGEPR